MSSNGYTWWRVQPLSGGSPPGWISQRWLAAQSRSEAPRVAGGGKVYIDSFPSGAEVRMIPKVDTETSAPGITLGRTPLTVDASQVPSMRFLVMMAMKDYVTATGALPQMKEWISRLRLGQILGRPGSPDVFGFDSGQSETSSGLNGELLATGPIYKLDWLQGNRLCALFVPRGVPLSALFPLMPKPGRYPPLPETWPAMLQEKYEFSSAQVTEALETLSRIGKYVTLVRNSRQPGVARRYSITFEGPPLEKVSVSSYEVRPVPGFND